jgi:Sulfotransferase family
MPLPTFLIVGERKSGTTALCRWIVHPDVYMHPREDLNYFIEDEILVTRVWRDGEADAERWERTHSPERYAELFEAGRSRAAIGEKSADLFFWRPAHERIARFLPDCKFIVVLRHPVHRAWSHYLDELGKGEGRETLSFDDALAYEQERASRSAYARLHLSYGERGYYDRSARNFLAHVPRSRVLIMTLEQMSAAPRETLQEVYHFIGVDPTIGLELAGTRHNEGGATDIPRSWARSRGVVRIARAYHRVAASAAERLLTDPAKCQRLKNVVYLPFRRSGKGMTMPAPTRDGLTRSYAPHVPDLTSLVGRDFGEWKLDSVNGAGPPACS